MTTSTQWQLAEDVAERYETILVPAILGPFAAALVGHVAIRPGDLVVDVGCGTGAASRFAAPRAGSRGRVVALDVNAGMLAVARRQRLHDGSAPVEWREGDACLLPVADGAADVILCAQTIQFLPDRVGALREMHRALRSGGRVAVSAWCAVDENPYFAALARSIQRRVGPDTAKGLLAAFTQADAEPLAALLTDAGFRDVTVATCRLDLALPPLSEFVPRHVSATPMAAGYARASEEARQAVLREVIEAMVPYGTSGAPLVPFRSFVATGTRT
jgi:SAM-dependent methyltransferase